MSLTALASTALHTARSTFQDLAGAAAGAEPVREGARAKSPAPAAAPGRMEKTGPVGAPAAQASGPQATVGKGRRFGTLLDAYA